jgi:DNA polymerase-3 subunit delta
VAEKPQVKAGQPVVLISGDDDVLREQAMLHAIEVLLDGADRSLALEELGAAQLTADREHDIAPLVDAAQTAPFLTERRVVVGRHLGMFGSKEAVAPLVAYLAAPLETTALVLVWEKPPGPQPGSRVPQSLTKAVTAAGGVKIDASAPRGKDQQSFVERALRDAGLKLDAAGVRLVLETIGGDLGRLDGVLALLVSTYGEGARLKRDDVAPYLGDAGDVAPWDLTDAIDGGDVPKALETLHRMTGAGERHAFVVMAVLQRHYEQMVRLDGADVRDEREAATLLGLSSPYPAKKALAASRRLGADRLRRAVQHLADADLDLRGRRAWPAELVLEVLVARLARLSRR